MIPLGLLAASRHAPVGETDIDWTPEGLPVGALLNDDPQWATKYISNTNFVVMEDGGEKYVHHSESGNSSSRIYAAMYLPSWTADTDATVDMMSNPNAWANVGCGFRRSNTESDTAGYLALITQNELTLEIQTADLAKSTLASVNLSHTATTERWSVRVRAVGSELSAKAWRTADPEPPGWMVTATDSTYPEGGVGFAGTLRGSTRHRSFYRLQSRAEVGD